jgi:hypothetical protein
LLQFRSSSVRLLERRSYRSRRNGDIDDDNGEASVVEGESGSIEHGESGGEEKESILLDISVAAVVVAAPNSNDVVVETAIAAALALLLLLILLLLLLSLFIVELAAATISR